jgi:hypothetical protein
MIQQIDICNMALSHIAVKSITSIDEQSEPARKCKLFYNPALDAYLRDHDWNFAGQNEALALIADETIHGWGYLYKYPSNCLFVRKIFDESTDFTTKDSELFDLVQSPDTNQKAIATDVATAYIRFTKRVTDANMFDPLFVEGFSYKLASLIAKPLTGNETLGEKMAIQAERIGNRAKVTNKTERRETLKKVSSYEDAR